MVGAHVHEPGVGAHVVDPVRDRVPGSWSGKSWSRTFTGSPAGRHSPARLRVLPDLLLLLGVHADHRVPAARYSSPARRYTGTGRPGPDAAGPRSPWRWPAAEPLPRAAAASPVCGLHRCPPAVSSPARCPTLLVVHSSGDSGSPRVESCTSASSAGTSPGSALGQLLRPAARPADPPRRRDLPGLQLRRAVRHRLPRRPGQPGHRADPAVPGRPGHRAQRQPPRLSSSTGSSRCSSGPISFKNSASAPIPGSWHATRRKLT